MRKLMLVSLLSCTILTGLPASAVAVKNTLSEEDYRTGPARIVPGESALPPVEMLTCSLRVWRIGGMRGQHEDNQFEVHLAETSRDQIRQGVKPFLAADIGFSGVEEGLAEISRLRFNPALTGSAPWVGVSAAEAVGVLVETLNGLGWSSITVVEDNFQDQLFSQAYLRPRPPGTILTEERTYLTENSPQEVLKSMFPHLDAEKCAQGAEAAAAEKLRFAIVNRSTETLEDILIRGEFTEIQDPRGDRGRAFSRTPGFQRHAEERQATVARAQESPDAAAGSAPTGRAKEPFLQSFSKGFLDKKK